MSCQCRDATLRTYQELRKLGQSEVRAYDAAVHVFRYFHPEEPRVEAYQTVADWLEGQEIGVDPGGYPWEPDPGSR